MDYRAIPAVVYTNPEVAGVGKTEEELKASGEYYNLVKIPMTYSGRFVAENETGNGLCKLLTNVNGQIIGCHLVGKSGIGDHRHCRYRRRARLYGR